MNLRRIVVDQIKRHSALHRWAVKAYSLRHPPPYRRPNMEFHFDAWNGISSLHYLGHRQIGEDNSGPHPYNEITQNRYETCPFADSRNGLPMNVTNLRLVMPHAADAYRFTTVMRNRYIARRRIASTRLNLVQAYLCSKFAVSLPAYLTRRRDARVRDGELQALETAFYMLGAAPFMLVRQMMARGDRTPLDAEPLSGQQLYELSDASHVLISSRVRACPGSPRLIREFYDVIMNGSYAGSLESKEVERALALLGDWDRFYDYAHAASRTELLVKLNQAATAQALLALHDSDAIDGDAERDLLRSALDVSLRRSYVHASAERSARAVLETVVDVLFALLEDHGEDALDALKDACGDTYSAVSAGGVPEAAHRMRDSAALVFSACQRDLLTVHRTLRRSKWPGITVEEFTRRTGGPQLARFMNAVQMRRREAALA